MRRDSLLCMEFPFEVMKMFWNQIVMMADSNDGGTALWMSSTSLNCML